MQNLDYFFVANNRNFSVNPMDSDNITNLVHMEQLVGTLLKRDSSGLPSPFIAKEWMTSNNNTEWTFVFRDNVVCEDGEAISPQEYKMSLQRLLKKYYLTNKKLPIFEQLIGFNKYLENNDLDGLAVDANNKTLTFKFNRPINSGLLEFLSMPYFGHYCKSNFDSSDEWKDNKLIISSGPYSLANINSQDANIIIKKRENFFSIISGAPDYVTIHQMDINSAFQYESKNKMIFTYLEPDIKIPTNMLTVKATPAILIAIVLSPNIKNLFHNIENRELFFDKFRAAQKLIEFPDKSLELSDSFYFHLASDIHTSKSKLNHFNMIDANGDVKVVLSDHLHQTHIKYFQEIFSEIFRENFPEETQVKVSYDIVNRNDPQIVQKYISNNDYDIRIAGVSIGSSFRNWLTELMFCSTLGINFPDPSGEICKLVSDANTTAVPIDKYIERFNQALYNDKSVIPVFHRGYSWIMSNNIDTQFSPLSGAPRFDRIRL